MLNPYNTLGVERDATEEEIGRAWRTQVKTHHPDRGGSSEQFRQIQAAYELLTNASERARYDQTHQTATLNVVRKPTGPTQASSNSAEIIPEETGPEMNLKTWQTLLIFLTIVIFSVLAIMLSIVTIVTITLIVVALGAVWLKRNP